MDFDMPATLEVPFDPLATLHSFLTPLPDIQVTRDMGFPQLGAQNSLQFEANNDATSLTPVISSTISHHSTLTPSDTPNIRKRKRNNQIVLEGNNKAGRQGKPRCGNCRKRHCKCIYTSKDSKCESCRIHDFREPCIKEWGPKKQARLVPPRRVSVFDTSTGEALVRLSRPISSHQFATDIDPTYPYIFQWGYSAVPRIMYGESRMNLVKTFAFVYGPLIQHSSLQHAICATLVANSVIRYDPALYVGRACESLRLRLNDPNSIDEGDLFATALLAMLDWTSHERYETHVNGFLAIMRHLYSQSNDNSKSYQLGALWKTVRDMMLAVAVDGNQENEALPDFAVSVLRLSEESQEICEQIGQTYGQPFGIQNVSDWFAGCLETLTMQPNSVPFRSYIFSYLANMKADVSLEENCKFDRWFQLRFYENPNRGVVAILCAHLVPLVVSVLNAPTTDKGRSSSVAIRSASAFFRYLRFVENTIPRTADDFTREEYPDSDDEEEYPDFDCEEDVSVDWPLYRRLRRDNDFRENFWELWDRILGAIDMLFPWVKLCEVLDVTEVGEVGDGVIPEFSLIEC